MLAHSLVLANKRFTHSILACSLEYSTADSPLVNWHVPYAHETPPRYIKRCQPESVQRVELAAYDRAILS